MRARRGTCQTSRDHGDVIVLRFRGDELVDHSIAKLVHGRMHPPFEPLDESLQSDVYEFVSPLHQAVGIEKDNRADRKRDDRIPPRRKPLDGERGILVFRQDVRISAEMGNDRWHMSCRRVHDLLCRGIDEHEQTRGRACTGQPCGKLVECLEYGCGIGGKVDEGGQGTPKLAHSGHGLDSVPDGVTDDKRDPTACDRHGVVPIATHRQFRRGDIARRRLLVGNRQDRRSPTSSVGASRPDDAPAGRAARDQPVTPLRG